MYFWLKNRGFESLTLHIVPQKSTAGTVRVGLTKQNRDPLPYPSFSFPPSLSLSLSPSLSAAAATPFPFFLLGHFHHNHCCTTEPKLRSKNSQSWPTTSKCLLFKFLLLEFPNPNSPRRLPQCRHFFHSLDKLNKAQLYKPNQQIEPSFGCLIPQTETVGSRTGEASAANFFFIGVWSWPKNSKRSVVCLFSNLCCLMVVFVLESKQRCRSKCGFLLFSLNEIQFCQNFSTIFFRLLLLYSGFNRGV